MQAGSRRASGFPSLTPNCHRRSGYGRGCCDVERGVEQRQRQIVVIMMMSPAVMFVVVVMPAMAVIVVVIVIVVV
jgi:hypothetical protein